MISYMNSNARQTVIGTLWQATMQAARVPTGKTRLSSRPQFREAEPITKPMQSPIPRIFVMIQDCGHLRRPLYYPMFQGHSRIERKSRCCPNDSAHAVVPCDINLQFSTKLGITKMISSQWIRIVDGTIR